MDHDLNVVGAMVVALADRMRDATEETAGMSGPLPAALASLHQWAGGRTVDTLAGGLRLSHSRTVRVIDRLEAEGLATRERDPGDGRNVLVHLTPAGERAGAAVLAARDGALAASLAPLAARDRRGARRPGRAGARGGHDRPPLGALDLPALREPRLRPRRGPLPGDAGRGRRGGGGRRGTLTRSVWGRVGSVAVVVPDERLEVMSEQAAGGRRVVIRACRGYGLDVLSGPLYADVEMAHEVHATRTSEACVPVPACIQVHNLKRDSPL